MVELKKKKANNGSQVKYAEKIRSKIHNTNHSHNLNVFLLTKQQETFIYNLGVQKFKLGNYQEAQQIFFFLTICDPSNNIYAKSYAGATHALGEHKIAYSSYLQLYQQNKIKNVDCLYYCALVLFEIKAYKQSLELFNEALSLTNENIAIKQFKQNIELHINMIKEIYKK